MSRMVRESTAEETANAILEGMFALIVPVDVYKRQGTAGGMDPAVQLLDTVVSTHVAYHDVADDILTEFHPWMSSIYFEADAALLAAARAVQKRTAAPLRFGRTVTGEQFISGRGREEILSKYAPLAVDMESAGIAHVCYCLLYTSRCV